MTNYEKAIKHFEETGELPLDRKPYEYVLHHKDQSLKTENPERYNLWNIDDLVVVTKVEHNYIHHLGAKRSDETRKKIGLIHKGRKHSLEARQKMSRIHKGKVAHNKGVPMTEEQKQKLSIAKTGTKQSDALKKQHSKDMAGRHWYNNGIQNVFLYECPDGFVPGRIKRGN